MVRWTTTRGVARTLGAYVAASARDLAGVLAGPRERPASDAPGHTPPTVDDLDLAGAEWAPIPWDTAEETAGYEATYDNGYVVVRRADDPYGPVWIVDEDVWEAFLDGEDEDAPFDER